MARVSMGYPDPTAEMAMLASHSEHDPLRDMEPVTDGETVQQLIEAIRGLHTSPALRNYVVDLVTATRQHRGLRLGASPRAGLQLLRGARAHAALAGRDHVLPEDVQELADDVLAHRVILTGESQLARHTSHDVIADVLQRTPVPSGRH
jgi:MoxR-like ATPase